MTVSAEKAVVVFADEFMQADEWGNVSWAMQAFDPARLAVDWRPRHGGVGVVVSRLIFHDDSMLCTTTNNS